MGNNRFKLSELIPNAWFYKLRDMGGKSRKNSTASPSPIKKHQTVPTPTTARSPRRRSSSYYSRPTKSAATTSDSSTATGTVSFSPEFRSDQLLLPLESSTFTPPPELELRPIITKPVNKPTTARKSSPRGVRLRLRSPRISTSKSAVRSRAVVKATVDPRRDFKDSMEEMIAENNIRASKDLEELLACYLCLNSDEYHPIIITVFKQIWLDLNLSPHD